MTTAPLGATMSAKTTGISNGCIGFLVLDGIRFGYSLKPTYGLINKQDK